jgi:hypothetical protein
MQFLVHSRPFTLPGSVQPLMLQPIGVGTCRRAAPQAQPQLPAALRQQQQADERRRRAANRDTIDGFFEPEGGMLDMLDALLTAMYSGG